MTWTDKEPGPTCTCGEPTEVALIHGKPILWCFGHTKAEGRYWVLPPERPEKWPNLTDEEMEALITSAAGVDL